MILKMYSVKDKLVGFGGPICFKDEKVATRWFEAFCKEKIKTEYTEAKYYELYEIGTFDSDNAECIMKSAKEVKLIMEGENFDEYEDRGSENNIRKLND